MKEILLEISFYHHLFLACLMGGLFFLVIALVLILRWDIRGLWETFSGRQASREILRLEKESCQGKVPEKRELGGGKQDEEKRELFQMEQDLEKHTAGSFSDSASRNTESEKDGGFRTVFLGR